MSQMDSEVDFYTELRSLPQRGEGPRLGAGLRKRLETTTPEAQPEEPGEDPGSEEE